MLCVFLLIIFFRGGGFNIIWLRETRVWENICVCSVLFARILYSQGKSHSGFWCVVWLYFAWYNLLLFCSVRTMSAEQQQFFLKWNDFQSNMVSSFKHLRDEKSFTDVTLACEGQTCKAHKMVLSACSPYFKSLLEVCGSNALLLAIDLRCICALILVMSTFWKQFSQVEVA